CAVRVLGVILVDGLAEVGPDATGSRVDRWQGRTSAPPYMLRVVAPRLGDHLRSMESVSELFPYTTPEIGGLLLFIVHIAEAVETAPKGHRHLLIGPAGVYAQPDTPPRTDRSV